MVAGWSTLGTALTVACFFPDIDMTPPPPPPLAADNAGPVGPCTAPSTNGTSPFATDTAVGGADDVIVLIPAAIPGVVVVGVGDAGEVGVVGCSVATGDDGVAKDDCC